MWWVCPEVAGLCGGGEREWREARGDLGARALGAHQASSDDQCRRRAGHLAVRGPAALRDDAVDEASLVLQVDEGGAAGGGRALAVGHDVGDDHLAAAFDRDQATRPHYAALAAAPLNEQGGVALPRHAWGPELRRDRAPPLQPH